MVENAEVAGDDLVLQDGPRGNIDAVAVIGDDDDRSLQSDILAEPHVARDRQMIQFQKIGNFLGSATESPSPCRRSCRA